jgi:hypothetical protein
MAHRPLSNNAQRVLDELNERNRNDALDAARGLAVDGLPTPARDVLERIFERNIDALMFGVYSRAELFAKADEILIDRAIAARKMREETNR